MASEQSSLEVLKRPVVAALTPKMSDAAIRAAFRICLSVRSLPYCRCGAKGYEAYHWACAEYVQNTSTQKPLIAGYLPMSSFGKNRTKKMMKRETAKKKRAKKKTTRATQSDHRVSLVVRLSFLPRERRHNKSRQAQILERGASRSAAVIRHNDQFKCGDIREFNLLGSDRLFWALQVHLS